MRVVIAEDQVLLREGLARLFADGGHEVAASRGDARDLVATVTGHRPDLVVVDVRMPPTFTDEGARAAYEIKRSHPKVGVLVLSQHIETSHAIELVTLGGFGYLLKDRVLAVSEFLDAAERVARGGSALDPQVVGSPPVAFRPRGSAGGALRTRTRSPEADGRGAHQQRHCETSLPERAHCRGARAPRIDEARAARAATTVIAASSPSLPICATQLRPNA